MSSTTRVPSVLTATAIMTATETIRPISRAFTYVASIHRYGLSPIQRAAQEGVHPLVDRAGRHPPARRPPGPPPPAPSPPCAAAAETRENNCICAASGSAAPQSRRVSLDCAPGSRRGCWSDAGCAGPRRPRTGSPRPSPSAAAPRTGSPRAGSLRLPPFQRGPSQTYRNWTSRISSSWVKVFANPTFPKNHDDRLLQANSFGPLPGTPSLRTPVRLFSSPPDKPAR